MYRLIVPIVDTANKAGRFTVYFEFNQTSEHQTSQSVDVALLDGTIPVVMIEAKRIGRAVGPDQISKYIKPSVRGIVTNGVQWVMCLDGRSKVVSLRDDLNGSK